MDSAFTLHQSTVCERFRECLVDNKSSILNQQLLKGVCNASAKNWLELWPNDIIKNPFTKYGTLPSQVKNRIKRKTTSAPMFISLNTRNTDCDVVFVKGDEDQTSARTTNSSSRDSLESFLNLQEFLYSRTKNPFFTTKDAVLPISLRQAWQNRQNVTPEFVATAIKEVDESHTCGNLLYDLECIVLRNDNTGRYSVNLFPPRKTYKVDYVDKRNTGCLSITTFPMSNEDRLVFRASSDSARAMMKRIGSNRISTPYDTNDDFMLTDAEDYAVLNTRFGRIVYSPKFQDENYMYRFVILTREAQEALEVIAKNKNRNYTTRFLTEYEIIREMGIQMSAGWEHFMYFKNQCREVILRKPL